jgi:DNA mismatch repair protein MutS2
MNSQTFRTLEFDSLRALVRRSAQTDMGRARIDSLVPMPNSDEVQRQLDFAREMIGLRRDGVRLGLDGIVDPTDAIARLKIQGTALEPLVILQIARLCDRALDARSTLMNERSAYPKISEIVAPLPADLRKLTASLNKKILPSGELDDRASPQLASIRHDLTKARSRITRSLEAVMRRSSEAIQEELVTVRNDRFVIPVRADHQTRVKGVAHGSSSSGATVFIEPLETIEANNELQQLREAEQREIAEILFALSEDLRRQLHSIELAAQAITELDFVNAKAKFAERFDCVVPAITRLEPGLVPAAIGGTSAASKLDDILELIEARHPLLEESLRSSGKKVVPVSFGLDDERPVMVISGANAGGKTVVLKTTGLLSLMALSGLPVPAKSARVPFYRSVLADIGDHQSLAANLSTFTSHVANIAEMIKSCEAPALVLLDEVGTGTDPEEGSALGVAVVDHFKRRGAHVLATTHYSGLKIYAANEPGVLNASVEFDEKTLQPTYRLIVGFAGSSSGLEIARRFGISDQIISEAATQIKQSSLDAIEYLRRIKHEAEEAEALRKALEEERAVTAEKFDDLDKQFRKRESQRQSEFEAALKETISEFEKLSAELVGKIEDRSARVKVEREAQRQAAELKRQAQAAARAFSQANQSTKLHAAQGEGGGLPPQLRGVRVVRDGRVVSDLRNTVKASEPLTLPPPANHADVPERAMAVGDHVRLKSFGSIGVIDGIKGDEAEVRVGSLHTREKLANLELVEQRVSSPAVGAGSLDAMRQRAATELHLHSTDSKYQSATELNLIGKKTDEATDIVDKFLDAAFLNGLNEVRIIHGHGTGALRKAITEMLAGHPHVARFAPAAPDKGGSGATIVELNS